MPQLQRITRSTSNGCLINNNGKKISADLNGYLSSVSGNISTEIKNKLKFVI